MARSQRWRLSIRAAAIAVTLFCLWLALEAQRPRYTVRAYVTIRPWRSVHYPNGLNRGASKEEVQSYCSRQSVLIRASDNIRKALTTLQPEELPKLDASVDLVKWLQERISVSYAEWEEPLDDQYEHRLWIYVELKHSIAIRNSRSAQAIMRAIGDQYADDVNDGVFESHLRNSIAKVQARTLC